MSDKTVGVIGLGGMGSGMARQLLGAGYTVRVWNRSAEPAEALVALGAQRAATPKEAAAGGIAITMVANDAALEGVTLGADGLLGGLGAEGVHISMSTVSTTLANRLAAAHSEAGGALIAAPVFGRPEAAASGKLWIMLSGNAAAKARARPVLETLGQGIFDIGDAPDAAVAGKIAGNFMIACATEAMSEAFTLLQKRGVDARAFHDMMGKTIFAAPIYQNYGRFILDQAFEPAGFKLSLGAKDVGLALATGAESGVPMPFAGVLRDRFLTSIAQGRGDIDWTSIALNVRADAGMEASTNGSKTYQ